MKKINENDLEKVVGGNGYPQGKLHLVQPSVKTDYLPLRSSPCWDDSNEIAQIYPGTRFYVDATRAAFGSGYTYYWADYNGQWGWVNGSFITWLD